MTPDEFKNWLDTMKANKQIRFDVEASYLLGVRSQTIVKYKTSGGNKQLALACAALYHNIKPWENGK